MPAKVDITGRRFGRLVVLRDIPRPPHVRTKSRYVRAVCDCGTEIDVTAGNLSSGMCRSCGCLKRQVSFERALRHGGTIGHRAAPWYVSWFHMVKRCTDPKNPNWPDYGGRGITVCERWLESSAFFEDMGERTRGQTIERIDNSRGYEPGNCRWASRSEQSRNTRANVRVVFAGKAMCLAEACERSGTPYRRVLSRLRYGWDPQRAFDLGKINVQEVLGIGVSMREGVR